MPGQQAPSVQNTLRQLVACPRKEENAKEQRTGSRNQGKVTASQAAHCRLDGHKAKNARKVQPHEKPISTQFKEKIRVMDGTNTSDPWQCIPQGLTYESPFQQLPTDAVPQPLQILSSYERNWQLRRLLLSFNFPSEIFSCSKWRFCLYP